MPIYWTLKSIPELSNLSLAERNRSWAHIRSKAFRHWQTWLGLLACAAFSAVGTLLGEQWGHATLGAAVGGGVGGLIYFQALVHVARMYYLAILVGRST
jgi:SNF family Na+-dependent transporter